MIKMILSIYEMAWIAVLPALIFISRLRQGWKERLVLKEKRRFDLWIHSASVGEAIMAADIISDLKLDIKILVTTNTAQGKGILRDRGKKENVVIRYLPFDMPTIMRKAFSTWRPKLAVLLETELWPSFIYEARRYNVPVIIINGRLSEGSFRVYMRFRAFWKKFSPDMIYAISEEDAERYMQLFGKSKVALMNNIKFEHVDTAENLAPYSLKGIIPDDTPLLIFGSIRKEEEQDIMLTIEVMLSTFPDLIIGLFPRHIERLDWWKNALAKKGIKWLLRSEAKTPISSGTVILWDRFGELKDAYSLGDAVFVGGSLRPCGGHNFLEPLAYGIIPCVGPFLDNFKWIDKELFEMGLVTIVRDWKDLAKKLTHQILTPSDKNEAKKRFQIFIKDRKGGKKQAVEIISSYLNP